MPAHSTRSICFPCRLCLLFLVPLPPPYLGSLIWTLFLPFLFFSLLRSKWYIYGHGPIPTCFISPGIIRMTWAMKAAKFRASRVVVFLTINLTVGPRPCFKENFVLRLEDMAWIKFEMTILTIVPQCGTSSTITFTLWLYKRSHEIFISTFRSKRVKR